jgi:hypothetical protein
VVDIMLNARKSQPHRPAHPSGGLHLHRSVRAAVVRTDDRAATRSRTVMCSSIASR